MSGLSFLPSCWSLDLGLSAFRFNSSPPLPASLLSISHSLFCKGQDQDNLLSSLCGCQGQHASWRRRPEPLLDFYLTFPFSSSWLPLCSVRGFFSYSFFFDHFRSSLTSSFWCCFHGSELCYVTLLSFWSWLGRTACLSWLELRQMS